MTTIEITAEQIIEASREALNREFAEVQRLAKGRGWAGDRTDATFFRENVIKYMTPIRIKRAGLKSKSSIICFAIAAAAYAKKMAFIEGDRNFARSSRNLHMRQMGCM